MTERCETRDGMRIDWDVPITMDDGLVLRADVFRPVEERPLSRASSPMAPMPRASRSRTAIRARGSAWWRSIPTSRPDRRNLYQKLGGGRPGEMGAARLCRACASIRAAPAARPASSITFSPRETQGLLRLHRMGRRAAVVERQGRAERHLLLRHQPVARRVVAAAASRRDVHLGGRGRLVSRHDASRRHALDLLGQLVRHAGEDRAVRRGRARQARRACMANWCAGRRR